MIGPQISGNNWGETAGAVSKFALWDGATEDVVREVLVEHVLGKIVVLPGRRFAYLEGSFWENDRDEIRVKQLAGDIPQLLRQKAAEYSWDPAIERKFNHAVLQYSSAKSRAEIIRAVKHHPKLQFDLRFEGEHPELLGLGNGVFDLNQGALRTFNPGEHLALGSRVAYDSRAKCPSWEQFIRKITGEDVEKAAFLQRAIGSSLAGTGNCLLLKGESETIQVFIQGISQVLGRYGALVPSLKLCRTHSVSPELSKNLRNRRTIFCEASPGSNQRERNLLYKLRLAGDEKQFAMPKYTMPSVWVTLSNGTRLDTSNERIWNETQVFAFEGLPTETISLLVQNIQAEYSGILNWVLEGHRMFKAKGFAPPNSLAQVRDEIRSAIDPIWYFCNRICIRGPELRVGSTTLYEHFHKWCQANGSAAVAHRTFSLRAQEFFGETRKDGPGNKYFQGVGIPTISSVPPNPEHENVFERISLKSGPIVDEDDDGIEARARALADKQAESWDNEEEEWT